MKKILVLLFLFMAFWGHAQSGISYQAVLMSPTAGQLPGADNPKSPLVNASICLRFSISASIGGIPEYQEIITASTDGFGMVNVVIGAVNPSGFAAISWVTGTKYLKVELDHTGSCNGSNTFSGVSEQPFTTVPFALYALNSGSGGGGGPTTTTLTGDVTGSGTGSFATALAASGVTPGVYGSATAVPTITVDAKGRITNATTTPIAGSSLIGSSLFNGNIIIGDGSNEAAAVAVTGDISISNTGLTTVSQINGTSLAGLPSGILKNTTSTGVPSIASAADFPQLNQNTTGTANNVTGVVAITNGGTGSATQNFVDLINDQTVVGNKIFSGNTSVGGTLNAGATTLSSTLGVTGATNLNDNLTIFGTTTAAAINATNINASGALDVSGTTTLANTNVNGTAAFNGDIAVRGITSGVLTDKFTVNTTTGTTTVNGNLNTSINSTIGGTLGVTGATTIGGALDVNGNTSITGNKTFTVGTGATDLGGTLNVTGTTTLNNNLAVRDGGTDKFTINSLNGNTTVAGTLNAGATTLASTLEVTGATTLNGNLTVRDGGIDKFTVNAINGDTTVAGTLNAGTSTLASATVSGTLNAGSIQNTPIGSTTASTGDFTTLATINDATIGGTLDVNGTTTLNGNLAVRGLTGGILTNKFTVDATTGNTTIVGTTPLEGTLSVNQIDDSTLDSDRIKTVVINSTISDTNAITVNAMSGRFAITTSAIGNSITVNNSYVKANSVILCTLTKNSDSFTFIQSVDAYTGAFTCKLNRSEDVEVNFLVIN